MPRLESVVLVNRDSQTADTAVYRKDLPKVGSVSAIDVGVRLQNGATNSKNKDLLSAIKKISLVADGNNYLVHITGPELFRHNWIKFGSPMPYRWTEVGNDVREVWFRLPFGRYLGDPDMGLMLDRFANVQLQIDYDVPTAYGAAGATTFTSGTFSPTVIMHQFPVTARPSFRQFLGIREFWSGTSSSSGEIVQDLPAINSIANLFVYAMKDNTSEGTVVSDIRVGKDNFTTQWFNQKWYNLQHLTSMNLKERVEQYKFVVSCDDTRNLHVSNVLNAEISALDFTKWVSGATAGVQTVPTVTDVTGNTATIKGHTYTIASTDAAVTGAAMSNITCDATFIGDVHGAVMLPFADRDTLADALTPDQLRTAQIGITQGGSGAVLGLVAEEIYRY